MEKKKTIVLLAYHKLIGRDESETENEPEDKDIKTFSYAVAFTPKILSFFEKESGLITNSYFVSFVGCDLETPDSVINFVEEIIGEHSSCDSFVIITHVSNMKLMISVIDNVFDDMDIIDNLDENSELSDTTLNSVFILKLLMKNEEVKGVFFEKIKSKKQFDFIQKIMN